MPDQRLLALEEGTGIDDLIALELLGDAVVAGAFRPALEDATDDRRLFAVDGRSRVYPYGRCPVDLPCSASCFILSRTRWEIYSRSDSLA